MKIHMDIQRKVDEIFSSQMPEIERLAEGFHAILEAHQTTSEREIELLRAMGDRGEMVKEQIKNSTVQHVLDIFDDCYFRATGEFRKPHQPERQEDDNE